MNSNIIVFLDFDGTLIEKDSLDVLFEKLISENSKSMSIYIGDGKSDILPAKECDLVFAKKTLLESSVIPENKKLPFEDFSTILKYFRKNII